MTLLSFRHEDDLLTIIDRVLQEPEDDVVLDFPEGSRLFASQENLSLLKREAEAGGKRIFLRTLDVRGHMLAAQTGIPLAKDTPKATGPAPRRFSDILPPREHRDVPATVPIRRMTEATTTPIPEGPHREKEQVHATEVLPIPEISTERRKSALRLPAFPKLRLSFPFRSGNKRRLLDAAIILAGIGVAFLVLSQVLPGVRVTVHARTDPVVFTLPATVAVSGGEKTIPGQRIDVEEHQERNVSASGSGDVTQRAHGTLTIYNAYSSSSQTLVATTRFVSQDGKLFRLDQTTVVPGANGEGNNLTASSVDAAVTADQAGPEYNIGPSAFSIPGFQGTPKFTAFTAKSTAAMTGGARGKVHVVTKDDVTKAQEGLGDDLTGKLREKFTQQVPQGLVVLDGAMVETVTVSTDVAEGTAADQVVGRAEGHKSAIAFSQADLDTLVAAALKDRIANSTDLVPDSVQVTPKVVDRDVEKGVMHLSLDVSAKAAWRVDPATVADAIAGKREGEIRGLLASQEAIANSEVSFTPFWVTAAPKNRSRIQVRVVLDGK